MLLVNLIGGLGNQMFQYAFGIGLSDKREIQVKFDTTDLLDRSHKENFTYRDFELHVFDAPVDIASDRELSMYKYRIGFTLDNLYYKITRKLKNVEFYSEKKYFAYEPGVLATSDNTYFTGYWQNERYFKENSELIRQAFSFRNCPEGKNKELARQLQADNSIAVHIRRGDYANNQHVQNVHGMCSPEYYQRAVELIASKVSEAKLYVFSDEPEWVMQNLSFAHPATYVNHNKGSNSFEDMRLMSLCKHNIIANSSFSWWGAWLNANPDKIVVAPTKWMQGLHIDCSDLIPKQWIRL